MRRLRSLTRPLVRSIIKPLASSVVVASSGGGGSSGPGPNDVVSNGEAVLSNTEQVTSTP